MTWANAKIKRIYVGENLVRPKYTIKYDFTTHNVLTFKYQWDNTFPYGYTAWSGYYTVKNWYSQWVTTWSLPDEAYVNNVRKITIKYSVDNAICWFALRNSNWQTWIRYWSWSSGYGLQCMLNNTLLFSEDIAGISWNADIELDFENLSVKYWTVTKTLDASFVTAFRTEWANKTMYIWIANWNRNAWSNNYYTYMQECIIEY
jgi:hypothetical protein